ncbi:cation transport protein-domain-containing protein [Peziza echinospora]|nr:cation transport protein-domain-containing protein [Peziza echinospora]
MYVQQLQHEQSCNAQSSSPSAAPSPPPPGKSQAQGNQQRKSQKEKTSSSYLEFIARNFLYLHYLYFILVSFFCSIVLYLSGLYSSRHLQGGSSHGGGRISYIDSIFLCVSAQTLTGLNTVNLSTLTTFQQFILFLLLILGSVVFVSISIIVVRVKLVREEVRRELKLQGDARPTEQQCEEVAGVEYRALKLLRWLVPAYFIAWQVCGCVGLGWWIAWHKPEVPRRNGLDPWWMGAFNAVSAFNNSGMSLLDLNVVPFQESFYVLITMSLLILAGNTCYPIFLRLIINTLHTLCPTTTTAWLHRKETLNFLLTHPRRCYPYLFQSHDTLWLLSAVVVLNGIDWAAFEILNIGNPVVENIPVGARIMDGLFQAFAVRSGGFQVVPVGELRVGVLMLYVGMMYISVYPIIMTIQNSMDDNPFTNRFVGRRGRGASVAMATGMGEGGAEPGDCEKHAMEANGGSASSSSPPYSSETVVPQRSKSPPLAFLKSQLSSLSLSSSSTSNPSTPPTVTTHIHTNLFSPHPLPLLLLAILIITIIETPHSLANPTAYSVFNIVFEAVSAFGTVGITVGLPGENFSFCGGWRGGSKIVLGVVMVCGRHRGVVRGVWGGVVGRCGGGTDDAQGEKRGVEEGGVGERERGGTCVECEGMRV